MPAIDLTGHQFTRLRVIERFPDSYPGVFWYCRCTCGNTKVVRGDHLRYGKIHSCGCYQTERRGQDSITHGMTRTPEHRAWLHAKDRCYNQRDARYHIYGARGITMCQRWRDSFQAFIDDMGRRPSDNHTLDRIDNEGPYSPENCRWATRQTQQRNLRKNVWLTHPDGTRLIIADWARVLNVGAPTLHYRHKSGWSDAAILTTPIRSY